LYQRIDIGRYFYQNISTVINIGEIKMVNPNSNKVHEAVREHYGSIARQSDLALPVVDSCCGPEQSAADCGCSSDLYNAELLEGLPIDVTGLSLGCGDPVTIAGLQAGETVLDLGSGGGIDCFLAARQVGEQGQVIGVDMTPEMLAKANQNKTKMGIANVEFRQGQIEKLPVEDNTIDVIMSNCVINLSPNKPAVFREAFRVLKPGGRISISDIVTEGEFSQELRAQLDKWAGCITGTIDVERYTGMMREAGFTQIEVVDKIGGDEMIPPQPGMPRVFSARIVAYKPT
jgi:arsenite methyltransferase